MSDIAATEQPQAGAEAPPPALDDTLSAEIDKLFDANAAADQRQERAPQEREPNGRFAAPAGSKENTETTDQPAQQGSETAQPSIDAPAAWSAAAKAHWATLPPELRDEIAKRESEAHQRITTDGQRLKGYESLEQVLGPRRAALEREPGGVAGMVNALFNLSDFANRDFPGFVQYLAQQRGVDLRTLIEPANGANAPAADPNLAALQAKVDQLGSMLSQREQADNDAQARQIASSIAEFSGQKTSDGKPMYPHFDKVRVSMGQLMAAGQASSLEQAYVKAVRLDDELWTADQKAKEAEQKAAADAEAKRKAAAAASATRSDPRSRSGSPGAAARSLDDTIMAELDRLGVA